MSILLRLRKSDVSNITLSGSSTELYSVHIFKQDFITTFQRFQGSQGSPLTMKGFRRDLTISAFLKKKSSMKKRLMLPKPSWWDMNKFYHTFECVIFS